MRPSEHSCSYPMSDIGSVWVCMYCGRIWECVGQYKSQTPYGPEWINPGKWVNIHDTQAPPWAIAEQREVRRRRKVEELAW